MKKVFVLGPNKCGTTSLHSFFKRNGLRSAHWEEGNLAKSMLSNLSAGLPILSGWEQYDCYSDMIFLDSAIYISPLSLAEAIFRQHYDQLFVFNTRNADAWIRSRELHRRGTDRPSITERLDVCLGGRYDASLDFSAYARLIEQAPPNYHVFQLEDSEKFPKLSTFLRSHGHAIEFSEEVSVNVTAARNNVPNKKKSSAVERAVRGIRHLQKFTGP